MVFLCFSRVKILHTAPLRLKINKVYSECPYQLSYIYDLVLIQIMRAKWANINKDHTTEERSLSLSLSPYR